MVLTIKLCTYATLNRLKKNCSYKNDLALNNLERLICHKTQTASGHQLDITDNTHGSHVDISPLILHSYNYYIKNLEVRLE